MNRELIRSRVRSLALVPVIAAAVTFAVPAIASAAVGVNGIEGSGHAVHVNGIEGTGAVVSPDGIQGTGK